MAIFRLLGDAINQRLGAVRTLRVGAISAIAGLSAMVLAQSSNVALAGLALIGAGFSVIVPLVFAAGGRASWQAPSAGIALISGSGYIGFLFGPPLIGFLAEALSLRVALGLLVLLSGAAVVLAPAVRIQNSPAGFANRQDPIEQ
jgi:MFS family permease